jgi:hypothetical protein
MRLARWCITIHAAYADPGQFEPTCATLLTIAKRTNSQFARPRRDFFSRKKRFSLASWVRAWWKVTWFALGYPSARNSFAQYQL